MERWEEIWRFETPRFAVVAEVAPEDMASDTATTGRIWFCEPARTRARPSPISRRSECAQARPRMVAPVIQECKI